MTYNPFEIDEEKIAKKEKSDRKEKMELDNFSKDFIWIMKRKQGRAFIFKMLERSNVFGISFNTNAMTMAFNEGNRNFGLKLLNDIMSICPENYSLMMKEQKKDE